MRRRLVDRKLLQFQDVYQLKQQHSKSNDQNGSKTEEIVHPFVKYCEIYASKKLFSINVSALNDIMPQKYDFSKVWVSKVELSTTWNIDTMQADDQFTFLFSKNSKKLSVIESEKIGNHSYFGNSELQKCIFQDVKNFSFADEILLVHTEKQLSYNGEVILYKYSHE